MEEKRTYADVFLTESGLARQGDVVFDGKFTGVKNRPVFGRGINDFRHAVQKQVGPVKINWIPYNMWKNMLKRAYYEKYHKVKPTYLEVEVSEEWFSLNNFLAWLLPQTYHGDDIQLDKEIIGRGKFYGPQDCILVPSSANIFITTSKGGNGCTKTGAYKVSRNKFASAIYKNGTLVHLGRFLSEEEAHQCWLSAKIEIANSKKKEWDAVDSRIFPNIIRIITENEQGVNFNGKV